MMKGVLNYLFIVIFASSSRQGQAYQVSPRHRRAPFLNYRNTPDQAEQSPEGAQARSRPSERTAQKIGIPSPNGKVKVSNIHQLHTAILDHGHSLRHLESTAEFSSQPILSHQVLDLMAQRFRDKTTPQNRTDHYQLALSIEGGGMRGAVSAGMAAAIASMGLLDTIDVIYGSSAGSVVGAYMVSRQLAVDVYTELLPKAKEKFVCKKRLITSLFANYAEQVLGLPRLYEKPGMNLSYVLDTILPETGLRPLDMESFYYHDRHHQKLRVASSCVDLEGNLHSTCFGTDDFTNQTVSDTGRTGLFACMEASMTVPGATGPPVGITRQRGDNSTSIKAFDAFCFEPLPYRSAVEEGATHVLVLRTRPQCFNPKTQPTIYETTVAPLYFQSHGEDKVARFFNQGGQQYVYLEDHLVLEQGRIRNEAVPIPPAALNYGVTKPHNTDRATWKKAHVLPVTVPHGTKELATLEQDAQRVLEAVRGGYGAAFDLLAPAVGLDVMTGQQVADLVFPDERPPDSTPQRKREVLKRFFGIDTVSMQRHDRHEEVSFTVDGAEEHDYCEDALAVLKSLPTIGELSALHTFFANGPQMRTSGK